jgi:hypothetical protein
VSKLTSLIPRELQAVEADQHDPVHHLRRGLPAGHVQTRPNRSTWSAPDLATAFEGDPGDASAGGPSKPEGQNSILRTSIEKQTPGIGACFYRCPCRSHATR